MFMLFFMFIFLLILGIISCFVEGSSKTLVTILGIVFGIPLVLFAVISSGIVGVCALLVLALIAILTNGGTRVPTATGSTMYPKPSRPRPVKPKADVPFVPLKRGKKGRFLPRE